MIPIALPTLITGVSRQPATQRIASQLEEADNVFLKFTRGCERRAGTRPLFTSETDKALDYTPGTNFIKFFTRDSTRNYMIIITPGHATAAKTVQVFDLATGAAVTVTYDTTYGDPKTYLRSGSSTLKFAISGDTIIVANTGVTCALTGTSATYNDGGGVSVDNSTSTNYKADYTQFPFPAASNGLYYYAQKDSVGRPAGYYVSQNVAAAGPKYTRVRSPEANHKPDPLTMPVKIYFNGSSFTVSCIDWTSRFSGDSETNPAPGFIGTTLRAITFHADRFWMGYADSVFGSPTGDYWNIWLENWQDVGDSDFIDSTLPAKDVSFVNDMASFENGLVIFGTRDQQFLLASANEGPITPTTFGIVPTTSVGHTSTVPPVMMGKQLYWVSDGVTKLYEYKYTGNGVSNIAIDCASHVEGYIGTTPTSLSVSQPYGMLFLSCSSSPRTLWSYSTMWSGDEKIQSAWCKHVFTNDIVAHCCVDGYLFIVFKRNNRYYLEKMWLGSPIVDQDMLYHLHMDGAYSAVGTYDSVSKTTSWELDFTEEGYDTVVLGGDWGARTNVRINVTVGEDAPTVLTANGDYSANVVWIGRSFETSLELSEPVVRDNNGKAQTGMTRIISTHLNIAEAGDFTTTVVPDKREGVVTRFTAAEVGTLILGQISTKTDFKYSIHPSIRADRGTITLASDSHLPLRVTDGAHMVRFTPGRRQN